MDDLATLEKTQVKEIKDDDIFCDDIDDVYDSEVDDGEIDLIDDALPTRRRTTPSSRYDY